MWQSLIVVVAGMVSSATSSHYNDDYSGVKMPQYGGGDYDVSRDAAALAVSDSEDYQGHSPDAPGSLDYKYEEEPKGKTVKSPLQEVENDDSWQKPIRKHRKRTRHEKKYDYYEIDKQNSEDLVPKLRNRDNHRVVKHRPRLKIWSSNRDTRNNKYNRDENEEVSVIENKEESDRDKLDFRGDNNKNDKLKYEHRMTTNTYIRRKPRRLAEGLMPSRPPSDIDDEDDFIADTRLRDIDETEEDFRLNIPPRNRQNLDRFTPSDDLVVKLQKYKEKPGSHIDYDNDYYDMKRVQDFKNKIPTLLRRTKARASATRTTSLLEDLLSGRRANIETTRTRRTTEVFKFTRSTTNSTTRTSVHTTNKTTGRSTTMPITSQNTSQEISLAEKSRLSILKKAQRKENFKSIITTKPPVLLQVTKRIPTVVMVEPPQSEGPVLRASIVPEDTSERLQKVKRLMRNKLIANAKNIQDLTDNWDEMVCDYIDMSLLNSRAFLLRADFYMLIIHICDAFVYWIRQC